MALAVRCRAPGAAGKRSLIRSAIAPARLRLDWFSTSSSGRDFFSTPPVTTTARR